MASTGVTRWQQARPAASMRDIVDRLFDESFFGPSWVSGGLGTGFTMDVYEEDNNYILEATLPGLRPEDVDISLQGSTLTIRGKVANQEQKENRSYLLREIGGGEFSRTITLPADIDASNVDATFDHGMLHLVLPKAPAYQSKRIRIKTEAKS